jgi:hypothetical protein
MSGGRKTGHIGNLANSKTGKVILSYKDNKIWVSVANVI